MTSKLQNYLRMFREEYGLSQEETAFLTGSDNATNISRYENNKRVPDLVVSLGYRSLFRASIRRLFAGLVQEVEEQVKHRVEFLVRKLSKQEQDRKTAYKVAKLRELASELGTESGKGQ